MYTCFNFLKDIRIEYKIIMAAPEKSSGTSYGDTVSHQKDVFGISGLVNPSYSSPKAATIEHDFIHGSADPSASADTDSPSISTADLLQKRMAEIEKNVGCPIFSPAKPGESRDIPGQVPASSLRQSQSIPGGDTPFDDFGDVPSGAASSTGAPPPMSDPYHPISLSNEGVRHTEEAQKRDKLASALSVLSIDASDGFLDADRERDKKLEMIEEIEDLTALFKDDGEDVSKVHIPTVDEPFETIQCTLKILKRHNDRRRFGSLADECIMLAATSLETICDGQREMFGFCPDLRGWSNHVRSKLRRMHHDTSQIASSIMNDYNIGPGMRLVIELIPNLIMYARNKSMKPGDGKTPESEDPEFDSAVERLRKR